MAIASRVFDPIGINIAQVSAMPQHDIGQQAFGNMGAKWIYGQAGAALGAGDMVILNNSYVASGLTTANSPRGAKVAASPNLAVPINHYAWFQVEGQAACRAAGAIAAGARINTTATAGAVDDDGTVGAKEIIGISAIVAVGAAGVFELQLSNPVIGTTI
jgi:hypothetical protein